MLAGAQPGVFGEKFLINNNNNNNHLTASFPGLPG